jgi:putative transposase
MPNYRRHYLPGGSYFFTVVTEYRAKILGSELARSCLRKAIKDCQVRWAFETVAFVLLEDHLHALWTLPEGDDRYSLRWSWIKKEFSKTYLAGGGQEQKRRASKRTRRERGFWQRRFWEHSLRDEQDFEKHVDYIHYNPVKHKLVTCPKDYPYSTFHSYVKQGVYDSSWGCDAVPDFSGVEATTGE